jgi:hypothetical protein
VRITSDMPPPDRDGIGGLDWIGGLGWTTPGYSYMSDPPIALGVMCGTPITA